MYIFHFLLVFDILQWTSLKPILVSKVPRIHNFKVNVVSFYVWFSTHTLEFWSRIPILLHSLDFVRMFICFIHEIGSNRLFVRTTVKRIYTKKKKKVESLKAKDISMNVVFPTILLKNQAYGFPFAFYKSISKNSDTDLRRLKKFTVIGL